MGRRKMVLAVAFLVMYALRGKRSETLTTMTVHPKHPTEMQASRNR